VPLSIGAVANTSTNGTNTSSADLYTKHRTCEFDWQLRYLRFLRGGAVEGRVAVVSGA